MSTTSTQQRTAICLAWTLLITLFFWLRYEFTDQHYHVDDLIVLTVAGHMVEDDSWDTNWLYAGNYDYVSKLPPGYIEYNERYTGKKPDFNADGYNLSGYITLCAGLGKVLKLAGADPALLTLTIHVFILFLSAATAFVIGLAGYRLAGTAGAFCSVLVFTLLPIAVQDAHYIRPDVYLTFLASVVLFMSIRLLHQLFSSLLWIGVCVGAASAVKPSQLALLVMPLIPVGYIMWRQLQQGGAAFLKSSVRIGMNLLVPMIIVFAGTAPWQLLNFDGYLAGMSLVADAYFSPTPPNRLFEFSIGGQLGYITTYFLQTLGYVLPLVMLYGVYNLWRTQRMAAIIISAVLLFHYLYFATVPMFFARSFSPVMPGLALATGTGLAALWQSLQLRCSQRALLAHALLILVCGVTLYTPAKYSILLVQHHLHDQISPVRKFEQQLKQQQSTWIYHVPMFYSFIDRLPETGINTRLFAVRDYHDPWTEKYLHLLAQHGYKQIAEFRGDFYGLVPNELTMVHEAGRTVYLLGPIQASSPQE